MSAITIGYTGTVVNDYGNPGQTILSVEFAANGTGTIDTIVLNVHANITGLKVGTFYGSDANRTERAHVLLGNVVGTGTHTFEGLSLAVEQGDVIGHYCASGSLNANIGGVNNYWLNGDKFDGQSYTYTTNNFETKIMLYGTGTTVSAILANRGLFTFHG